MEIPKQVIVFLTGILVNEWAGESFTASNTHFYTFKSIPEALENTLIIFQYIEYICYCNTYLKYLIYCGQLKAV